MEHTQSCDACNGIAVEPVRLLALAGSDGVRKHVATPDPAPATSIRRTIPACRAMPADIPESSNSVNPLRLFW